MDPIKLERFAQLCAEIDAGAPEEDLLEREKLSAEAWAESKEIWVGKMAEEAEQKRFVLTNRYNTAFNTKRRLLAAKRPSPPQPPAPAPTPAIAIAPAPKPQPPAPPAPLAAIPRAAPISSPPRAPEPSFASPWMAEPPPPAPALGAAPPDMGGTLGIADDAAFAEALPFLKAAREAYRASLKPSPPVPTSPSPRDLNPLELPGSSAGLTLGIGDMEINAADIMPFLKPGPKPGSALKKPDLPARTADVESTVFLPHGAQRESAAMPFQRAPAPAPKQSARFTLEQFASLTAEIAAAPAKIGEVRRRYGLDEASHRGEAEIWQARFASEAGLFARYAELVQRYREWIERGGR